MDTPNMLRGEYYSTHLVQRCPNFNKCQLCSMCTRYNQHDSRCATCEDRKVPLQVCTCTERNYKSQVLLEEKTGAPLFDPDRPVSEQGSVMISDQSANDDWGAIVDSLNLNPSEG
jgi:hypothetical protein